jgi:asparagine N-glycosylation enzyme membrane subunit Stt3
MDVVNVLKGKWWVFVLIFILLYSYSIRTVNTVPDRILSFDPTFQYRYTSYFAEYGHLPAWDELTYYVGRLVEINTSPPFMYYSTSVVYWLIQSLVPNLITLSSYMAAVYGAIIIIPAFLLARELSNKYGGLLAAALAGTAPQILTRTFGSSYDTDQLVLFFLLLTLYLGFYALRKKTVYSYCLALMGFSAFLMTWGFSMYSMFILIGFIMVYFVMNILIGQLDEKIDFGKRIRDSLSKIKDSILMIVGLIAGLGVFAFINGENILYHLASVVGFAQSAEQWIVNISIAELQPFSIFNIEGWIVSMGRFVTGNNIIDIGILLAFTMFIALGFFLNFKKRNIVTFSILLTLLAIGVYTTFRGIRFTEFTSALFIVLIGAGFGVTVKFVENDMIKKTLFVGLAVFIALLAMGIGSDMGSQLGPDINSNWDDAWQFLKTQTPELSIVGTWWDPGHMINTLAERRNFADGAHCHNQCLYTINDRITDLGNIMVTSDENESLELIRKYQGDSPAVYWIASDDLIGKFRWLQYFGTGCDGTGVYTPDGQNICPLYIQLAQTSQSTDDSGNMVFLNYNLNDQSRIVIYNAQIPVPMLVQGINIAFFDEFIVYNGTQAVPIKFSPEELEELITALKPLESQLGARFTNQTIPMTVWMPRHYQYIVIIPPNLRNSVFTKMFMLEGEGLDHFQQVFRNEQVKIYKVI